MLNLRENRPKNLQWFVVVLFVVWGALRSGGVAEMAGGAIFAMIIAVVAISLFNSNRSAKS